MQSSWSRYYLKTRLLACRDEVSVSRIHCQLLVSGMFWFETFSAQLLASYARVGDIPSARQLFDMLPQREIDSWNAILAAYSRRNCQAEVLGLYEQMKLEGVRRSSSSFTMAIKACAGLLDLEKGEEIRECAVGSGYEDDVYVESAVLNLYAKCGKMSEAMRAFDKMRRRDIVSWTTMITALSQCERGEGAVDLYRRMRNEGIEGDRVAMLGIIKACAAVGDPRLGLSTHGHLVRKDLMDSSTETSLLSMYAKHGYMKQALHVFETMHRQTVISWGALVSGFAQNGYAAETLELLAKMVSNGFDPEVVSIVSALSACSQVGYFKLGKSIHGYITRRLGYERVSGTGIIDLYTKCGSFSSARAQFECISSPDLVCWNAMIAAYGVHGQGKEALSLFIQLTEQDIQPNHATFAALLSALSHSGLVEEGQYWFHKMISQFHIAPMEKHYACMVDLLSRAGKLDEAHKLLQSAETEVGISVWVSLLSGSHNHGSFYIGEAAAEKILKLNPDDLGIYALISNFFAAHRKWDQVAKLRNIMRQKGIKKAPSYSLVDVNGKLCAFLMGDETHQDYEEIESILDQLDRHMKSAAMSS
uniref:Pentatricopeptide repeat-containing protein n=1 Tax=Kalanchoe fedtschenkoi TaxID=63787 RepID=A0A7N1A2F7_KALFE